MSNKNQQAKNLINELKKSGEFESLDENELGQLTGGFQ